MLTIGFIFPLNTSTDFNILTLYRQMLYSKQELRLVRLVKFFSDALNCFFFCLPFSYF